MAENSKSISRFCNYSQIFTDWGSGYTLTPQRSVLLITARFADDDAKGFEGQWHHLKLTCNDKAVHEVSGFNYISAVRASKSHRVL
jgi:hypothetical protein